MGLPAKRWLPPQWSKCRCVLTTMSMPARSKFCVLSGRRRGSRSAAAGGRSVMPVSLSTRAQGDVTLVHVLDRLANSTCTPGGVERFLRGIEVVHDDVGLSTSLFEGH